MRSVTRIRIPAFAVWVWLLPVAFPVFAVEEGSQSALFSPHANIVLLSGLSGDMQTETVYKEQLQNWLEFLDGSVPTPEKIFVFSDAPESLNLPAKTLVQGFKSSRESFLALGRNLAGKTNPLVVIVWGHGGMQGSAPVFHVAGPRLTARDFREFADQMPMARSGWILSFRGSGRFAAELAGEGRSMITSEKETIFESDPVGLPLVYKLLRASPTISINRLGTELGRLTQDWYKEHNLVRTEEPTLWLGTSGPQLLSPLEASADQTTNNGAEHLPESLKDDRSPGTNRSASWEGIVAVEPQNYPEADGVVLRRRIHYSLSGDSPAITSESEEFIQALSAEGKRLGDFDFSYSPPDEDMQFVDCEVRRPDGKLLAIDPDEIRPAGNDANDEYRSEQHKVFSLPGVVPGAILHIKYLRTWRTFPMPHISLQVPIAGELPTIDSSVEVEVPRNAAFHFAFDQISAADPIVKETAYGSSYAWHFRNLGANEPEALSASFREPSLLISTFPDWESFADWYARISKLADTVTPEIAACAAQLTSKAKTDSERAGLLFNFVTSLRYVAVPLGINSFRPHAASEVLKHQYGDCKDKANLYNALLRSVNIDARLTLVPRFSQAYDNLPGFAFNHAISQVKLGDEIIFVDTTDDVCRFGMLPPGDPGRRVLVIEEGAKALTQLPPPIPGRHELILHAEVDCRGEPDTCPATIEATAKGFADYELRAAAGIAHGRRETTALLSRHFRASAGVFGMEKQTHTSAADLNEDFAWHGDGFFAGITSGGPERRVLRAPFWLPLDWDRALNHRTKPLFLNEGYPLLLEETVDIALPQNATQITLPPGTENAAGPLSWKMEWSRSGTKVDARLQLELTHGDLTVAETSMAQKQLRSLFGALAREASFSSPP